MKKIEVFNKLSKYYAFANISNLEIYDLIENDLIDKESLENIIKK